MMAYGGDSQKNLETVHNSENLESQIQSKIKDLEQKYNSNIQSQGEGVTADNGEHSNEGEDFQEDEDQDRNVTFQEDEE